MENQMSQKTSCLCQAKVLTLNVRLIVAQESALLYGWISLRTL